MKKVIGGLLVLFSAMFSLSALAANYSFDFLSNDSTYEVKGNLNASNTLNSLGSRDILNITGDIFGLGGGSITGLVINPDQPNPTVNYGFLWDNTLPLNNNGVTFTAGLGSIWNLFAEGDSYRLYSYNAENGIGNVDKVGSMVTTPVPEPETYAMLMAGIGLIGVTARRRNGKQSSSMPTSMMAV